MGSSCRKQEGLKGWLSTVGVDVIVDTGMDWSLVHAVELDCIAGPISWHPGTHLMALWMLLYVIMSYA